MLSWRATGGAAKKSRPRADMPRVGKTCIRDSWCTVLADWRIHRIKQSWPILGPQLFGFPTRVDALPASPPSREPAASLKQHVKLMFAISPTSGKELERRKGGGERSERPFGAKSTIHHSTWQCTNVARLCCLPWVLSTKTSSRLLPFQLF